MNPNKIIIPFLLLSTNAIADSSTPRLAGYYNDFLAICNNVVFEITPKYSKAINLKNIEKVAIGKEKRYALNSDGQLFTWEEDKPILLMEGIKNIYAGKSGLFTIKENNDLFYNEINHSLIGDITISKQEFIDSSVFTATIGDSANYYIKTNGDLYVKGLAHRGQYGDGKLKETDSYVKTASDAKQVVAHTGHALYLSNKGVVYGTGGNYYGSLGHHGIGDKAIYWGEILPNIDSIATGSSNSIAIQKNISWNWGKDTKLSPRPFMKDVVGIAMGSTMSFAISDNKLYSWKEGTKPSFLMDCK